MRLLATLMCLAIAGCASPEQIAARHDQTCREWGARPGTEAYLRCRAHQQSRDDAKNAAIGDAIAGGMSDASRAYAQQRPTTCYVNGRYVTCY